MSYAVPLGWMFAGLLGFLIVAVVNWVESTGRRIPFISPPLLRKATHAKWQGKQEYRLWPAAFLWKGYEPVASDDDQKFIIGRNREIREFGEELFSIVQGKHSFPMQEGVDFNILESPSYRESDGSFRRGYAIKADALRRLAQARCEPIPMFLRPKSELSLSLPKKIARLLLRRVSRLPI